MEKKWHYLSLTLVVLHVMYHIMFVPTVFSFSKVNVTYTIMKNRPPQYFSNLILMVSHCFDVKDCVIVIITSS